MTTFTGGALNGNKTDVEGFFKPLAQLYTPGVAMALNADAMKVTQRGAGANMSVDVAPGVAILQRPDNSYSYQSWIGSIENVVVTAANPTNPRIDTVVAWVDITEQTTATNNAPGSLKLQNIAGTPSGTPAAVNDATIQSTLGSGIAWVKLATILVGAGVTTISNAVISEARTPIRARVTGTPTDLSVSTAKIAASAVTQAKISQGFVGYNNVGNFSNGGNGYTMAFKQLGISLTGLTVGREYAAIGQIAGFYNNVANKAAAVGLYLGTTQIAYAAQANSSGTFQKWSGSLLGTFTATATSHDLNVWVAVDSGTTLFVEGMRILVV